jgi:uncharacterized protein YndB with AHSA1/START domain
VEKNLIITTPSETEIRWSRQFQAPAARVFDALTKPEYLRRWLLGPPGWVMSVCEVDLRVGGRYRYVWEKANGTVMRADGSFIEITPTKLVSTEQFEPAWYSGQATTVAELSERDGITTLTQTVSYESKAARDGVLSSGFESGVEISYERLRTLVEG